MYILVHHVTKVVHAPSVNKFVLFCIHMFFIIQ